LVRKSKKLEHGRKSRPLELQRGCVVCGVVNIRERKIQWNVRPGTTGLVVPLLNNKVEGPLIATPVPKVCCQSHDRKGWVGWDSVNGESREGTSNSVPRIGGKIKAVHV